MEGSPKGSGILEVCMADSLAHSRNEHNIVKKLYPIKKLNLKICFKNFLLVYNRQINDNMFNVYNVMI